MSRTIQVGDFVELRSSPSDVPFTMYITRLPGPYSPFTGSSEIQVRDIWLSSIGPELDLKGFLINTPQGWKFSKDGSMPLPYLISFKDGFASENIRSQVYLDLIDNPRRIGMQNRSFYPIPGGSSPKYY